MTPEKAIEIYGADACAAAYGYNIHDGEGGTFIEINTGIPKRHQCAAIKASEKGAPKHHGKCQQKEQQYGI